MSGASLQSASELRAGIVGTPTDRRCAGWIDACESLGHPRPTLIPWRLLASDTAQAKRALSDIDVLRIDSPGEDAEVAMLLARLGGRESRRAHGEIAHDSARHAGFRRVLEAINETGVPCLNSVPDILAMFDKWQAHARFTRAGLPRPVTELAPTNASVFLEHCRAVPAGRVFLKPRYGSSASGCCALRWQGNRIELHAPIEIERSKDGRVRLFNTLRVDRYLDLAEISTILDRLLPEGMIQERWLPKATLPGGSVDLRILVVAGEARHRVLRQSTSPMTNLHLGNRRADTMELERRFPGALRRACRLAVDAAACFPDSLYAGVDILLDTRGRAFVCEINAFGDLLPGLSDRGQTTFEAIATAAHLPRLALEATSHA